ncbi:YbaB/EbfC family nucleoid-associated protein [Saccharopolyspora hirsuta]|uniref:YbaB/EbfC family nucleoid-associated protein n=1 Tax=Saccharopolyspora hirsuta TaxID=1837 RepID=A0A5M7BKI0_SACHI|nr:YbaB/EbfC family nucleoid-associated protein [Saccharopolyspora hirsuta]KAA5830576.1 YbaB/EbfC family nucleoid-associated protein [Saccharopolyspora hirsuta]
MNALHPAADDLPELTELVQRLQHQQAEVDRIRQDVDTALVSGRSRDDEVTATVRGTGRFTEVAIDPEVLRRYDARDIGEMVAEAANDALDRLARLAEQRLAPVLGSADERA